MKIASAPHSFGSVARHFGWPPPPHSSEKSTFVPSLLNVAECQYEKFESADGGEAHRMRRIVNVEQQAVAFARAAGEADRRIHRDVVALRRAASADPAVPTIFAIIPGSASRSAALSAAVGAPVPPRFATMLSSIGFDEATAAAPSADPKMSAMNAPLRTRRGDLGLVGLRLTVRAAARRDR